MSRKPQLTKPNRRDRQKPNRAANREQAHAYTCTGRAIWRRPGVGFKEGFGGVEAVYAGLRFIPPRLQWTDHCEGCACVLLHVLLLGLSLEHSFGDGKSKQAFPLLKGLFAWLFSRPGKSKQLLPLSQYWLSLFFWRGGRRNKQTSLGPAAPPAPNVLLL